MRIDRRDDLLFITLLAEARDLEIEEAEECNCLECLIIAIETFWERKRNAVKLDLLNKLMELSNKLRKYFINLKLKESEKLLKLITELEEEKNRALELERIKVVVEENANNIPEDEEVFQGMSMR